MLGGVRRRKPWKDPGRHQHSRKEKRRGLQRQPEARADGGKPGAHSVLEAKGGRVSAGWGPAWPGGSPPGRAAHLGSTSSCLGPATLCRDRHTNTWESGRRSEEQEGTGTRSLHWAGQSARRRQQLMGGRGTERWGADGTCQVFPPPEDDAPPTRLAQKAFSTAFIGHFPALYLVFYPYFHLILVSPLRGR